jgi:hypothetical protein
MLYGELIEAQNVAALRFGQFHSFTAEIFFVLSLFLLLHAGHRMLSEPGFTGDPLNDRLGQTATIFGVKIQNQAPVRSGNFQHGLTVPYRLAPSALMTSRASARQPGTTS